MIEKVRELFNRAHAEKEKAAQLLELTENSSDPVLKGYFAAGSMVMTKYVLNPFSKLPMFNKGKSQLDEVVNANLHNIELIYLRYTIQINAPSFLRYNANIAEDRVTLIEYMKKPSDKALYAHIKHYFDQTNDLSPEENEMILKAQN